MLRADPLLPSPVRLVPSVATLVSPPLLAPKVSVFVFPSTSSVALPDVANVSGPLSVSPSASIDSTADVRAFGEATSRFPLVRVTVTFCPPTMAPSAIRGPVTPLFATPSSTSPVGPTTVSSPLTPATEVTVPPRLPVKAISNAFCPVTRVTSISVPPCRTTSPLRVCPPAAIDSTADVSTPGAPTW